MLCSSFARHASHIRHSSLHLATNRFSSTATHTPLEKLLVNSIKATGPITVSNYMQLCLGHPTYGYYMNRDPLGKKGDFITSPEISQLFGELIAIWFLSALAGVKRVGEKAKKLRLIELGPGRGTLTADILRVITNIKSFPIHSVHLVETSSLLRSKQAQTLEKFSAQHSISWHEYVEDIPSNVEDDVHTLLVANEFLDALPINVFERAAEGWCPILVDTIPSDSISSPGSEKLFRLVRSSAPVPLPAFSTNPRYSSLPVGSRVEYSHASTTAMRQIAKLISSNSNGIGMALLIDYGADHLFGDSFRGIKNHQIVDPLEQPGVCDLTANVDFASLRDAIRDISSVQVHGPTSQRDFFLHMGLEARLAGLMRGTNADAGGEGDTETIKRLKDGGMKLIDAGPDGMGIKFQILGVTSGLEVVYPWV